MAFTESIFHLKSCLRVLEKITSEITTLKKFRFIYSVYIHLRSKAESIKIYLKLQTREYLLKYSNVEGKARTK